MKAPTLFAPLLCLAALVAGCGPAEHPTECYEDGQEVHPEQLVRGHRAADLLGGFLGIHHGSIHWETGTSAALTFDIQLEESGYRLGAVYQCRPGQISCHTETTVTSSDGAFEQTPVHLTLYRGFPRADGYPPAHSITSFAHLTFFEPGPELEARLGVDHERYASFTLLFDLDWPVESPGPLSGKLTFHGTLRASPAHKDIIQVATLAF